MTTFLLVLCVLLLTAGLILLAKVARQQKAALATLRAEEEAIVAEERRMFHYLHDLGEATWRDDQQASMYRLIVEGAVRVTQSTGGALYLLDEATQRLHITATVKSEVFLQLELEAVKPLMVFGKDGVSRKGASAEAASHYLTWPRLKTSGTVKLGADEHAVSGDAWMDHEFSSSQLEAGQVGWEVLLNRAGTTFKKLPDGDKQGLTEKKAIALMQAQPSMIKRPVVDLGGGKLLLGFKPDAFAAAFKA